MRWLRCKLRLQGMFLPLLILAIVFFIGGLAFGQSIPAETSDDSNQPKIAAVKFFTVDYAVLRYDENFLLLETYALVDRGFLQTRDVEDGKEAQYQITFKVFEDDSLITGDSWTRIDFRKTSEEWQTGQRIPELMKYLVKPGPYRIEVSITDLVANVYRSEDFLIEAKPISNDRLAVSDIIIASRIEKVTEGAGEFDHNGLLVLPNADRMFGLNANQMFFYTELYNLSTESNNFYTVIRNILNQAGERVLEFPPARKNVAAADLVDYGGFSIDNLSTGSYTLQIVVIDSAVTDTAITERTFWVYRPGEEITQPALTDPGFDIAALSIEDIDWELRVTRYLMTKKIQQSVKHMEPEVRRAFLARFWTSHDPNKDTRKNELREEYLRRVRESNARFGSFNNKEGWRSDRGRVYCLYGEPSDIEYHPFDVNAGKAYQIWTYDALEGGTFFIFVDRNNYGDYIMVHSNKDGEVYNPNWHSSEVQGF